MNTVGKILVILNFVFAVLVGAFLVVDFATRTNWKTEADKLKGQLQVIAADRETAFAELKDLANRAKEHELNVEKLKGDLADQETRAKAERSGLELQLKDALDKAKGDDLTGQKTLSDLERLRVSETDLKKVIKDREEAILKLNDDVKTYRTQALTHEANAKALADRNQQLLDQVEDLGKKLAQALAGTPGAGSATSTTVRSTGYEPNPPATLVKGKVERVDASLVQISIGTDQGVHKNNTMEIFRTSPAPKYLGMIRIEDASPNQAVGRLVTPPGSGVRPQQLKVGDQVWSWLSK